MLMCFVGNTQQTSKQINIQISVFDSVQQPVTGFFVKAKNLHSQLILWYANASTKNYVNVRIPMTTDSIEISVSAAGFDTWNKHILLSPTDIAFHWRITLIRSSRTTLPDAHVIASPTWKRGDTTFFRVSAYTDPSDRKLKDIITKLPGFELNEDGRLLYKRKAVQQITIDGEEIFADKLQLMLNSFPVHVLEQIQALENQTNNPLLKGLHNEQQVFVNLALKKEKLKAAFGDGEIGMGTQGRYTISPVLFALYGKLKGGLIGNYNSLGEGFDWKMQEEMKQPVQRAAEPWMLQPSTLAVINNVAARRYIRNELFDTRLQLNWAAGKLIKLKTEINFVADKQSQESSLVSSLLNANTFFERTEINKLINKPRAFLVNQEIIAKPDSLSQWVWLISASGNFSKNQRSSMYNYPIAASDTAFQDMNNRWGSAQLHLQFTKRIHSTKAKRWWISTNTQLNQQTGIGVSNVYQQIFQLPAKYHQLVQQMDVWRVHANTGMEWLHKPRKRLFTYGIQLQHEAIHTQPFRYFTQPTQPIDSFISNTGSFKDRFAYTNISIYTSSSFLMQGWPITFKSNIGVQLNQSNYPVKANHIQPALLAALESRKQIGRNWTVNISINAEASPLKVHQQIQSVYPVSLQAFKSYANTKLLQISNELQAGVSYGKGNTMHQVYGIINRHWNGNAISSRYVQFVQVAIDSFNRVPMDGLHVGYNVNQNYLQHNFQWTASIGSYQTANQYSILGEILSGKLQSLWGSIILIKSWQKKYYVTTQLQGSHFWNIPPAKLQKGITQKVLNISAKLKNSMVWNKWLKSEMEMNWLLNNIRNPNSNKLLLLDFALLYTLPEKPYSFSIKAENLLNAKRLQTVWQNPDAQSFFSIPLVPLNFMLSARIEL